MIKASGKFYNNFSKYIFNFGKYRGKTGKYVLDNYPDYLEWCHFHVEWFKLTKRGLSEVRKEQKRKFQNKLALYNENKRYYPYGISAQTEYGLEVYGNDCMF